MNNGITEFDLNFIKTFILYSYRELTGDEYEEMRLILALLDPIEIGSSLHCIHEKYFFNDKVYQVTYELSDNSAPIVIEEVINIEMHDK